MKRIKNILRLVAVMLLLGVCVNSNAGNVQTLRLGGSVVGKIEANGDVRINGSIKGRFESNGDIRVNGSIEGKIENNGDIRKSGSIIGRVENMSSKRQAAVMYFFGFFAM